MKSSKIKKAGFNNRKKSIWVATAQAEYELPYSRLMLKPTSKNLIEEIFVDKELASTCVTYRLRNGKEDSVPLDAFLDFNRDPEYLRRMELYKMTIEAEKLVKKSKMSKRAICRLMGTSLSQLSRLLDTRNYSKSMDQMHKLLTILGAEVEIRVA